MRNTLVKTITACVALCIPAFAQAHPGHDSVANLANGLAHPFAGMDHLLALIATGLLARRMGSAAGVGIVMSFLALLAAGVVYGLSGRPLPGAEAMVIASLIVLAGLAVRPARRFPLTIAALAGGFALFHGYAHGSEAAAGASAMPYVAGILASSTLICLATAAADQARARARRLGPHRTTR